MLQKTVKNVVQEQEKELEQKTGIEANMDEDIRSIEEVLQKVGKTGNKVKIYRGIISFRDQFSHHRSHVRLYP